MLFRRNITVRPLTGRERRRLYIYQPDSRLFGADARYPVLYMFDGHNVFLDEDATYGKSWGMLEYLQEHPMPLMIVAVECNHHPDNGRLKEYSPWSFTDDQFGEVEGRGKTYMDWMVHTLKPLIDRHYPTLPDRAHTWIAGSSMGGLMSLYGVLAYNDVFSRCAALSPSIWVNGKRMRKLIREGQFDEDTCIYMDYGSREMEGHDGMDRQFALTAAAMLDRRMHVTARIIPNGDHCEACWEEQLPFFMPLFFYSRE
ncbi:MAG: alpha/beta hydrolase [Clostridia bacterium]|nr:alpha/beta hydrolase [Clostridia bacterium]